MLQLREIRNTPARDFPRQISTTHAVDECRSQLFDATVHGSTHAARPDGGRADEPRRARLRHLLASAQRQHHLHRHADRRQIANLVIAQMLFLEAEDPDKDIQLYINSPAGRLRPGWPSTTRCSSSSRTSRPSASARRPRWRRCCWRRARRASGFRCPNSRIVIHQPLMSGLAGQATDIDIAAREILRMRERHQRNPGPPHRTVGQAYPGRYRARLHHVGRPGQGIRYY